MVNIIEVIMIAGATFTWSVILIAVVSTWDSMQPKKGGFLSKLALYWELHNNDIIELLIALFFLSGICDFTFEILNILIK